MKTSFLLALVLCAFSVVGCRTRSTMTNKNGPAVYKVAFENEKLRVIEYQTGSEKDVCGFGMHTHPPHLYIMLTDAKLRIVDAEGKETFEDSKAGDTGWAPAEKHLVENLSGKNAGCYIVEIKDHDWQPSTGLTR